MCRFSLVLVLIIDEPKRPRQYENGVVGGYNTITSLRLSNSISLGRRTVWQYWGITLRMDDAPKAVTHSPDAVTHNIVLFRKSPYTLICPPPLESLVSPRLLRWLGNITGIYLTCITSPLLIKPLILQDKPQEYLLSWVPCWAGSVGPFYTRQTIHLSTRQTRLSIQNGTLPRSLCKPHTWGKSSYANTLTI